MAFGSARALKNRVATELCAVLALAAIKNHDKAGLVLFSDRIERFLPPRKGTTHVLRLIREVLSFEPVGHGTNLRTALDYLAFLHRKAVVFVISDFFCDDIRAPLALANRRHDVIAVHVVDPRQESLPPLGWIRLEDVESGRQLMLNSADAEVRKGYGQWTALHRARVRSMTGAAGVDLVEVRTDKPAIDPLLRFFRARAMRR
jgi:uncharacterized protein (DUF58 family)